jgi:hypothetical protein
MFISVLYTVLGTYGTAVLHTLYCCTAVLHTLYSCTPNSKPPYSVPLYCSMEYCTAVLYTVLCFRTVLHFRPVIHYSLMPKARQADSPHLPQKTSHSGNIALSYILGGVSPRSLRFSDRDPRERLSFVATTSLANFLCNAASQ